MDKLSNTSNKNNSRFIITIIMAIILISIAAWAAIQSVSGVNNTSSNSNPAAGNDLTAAPASTPGITQAPESISSNGQVDMEKLASDILSKTKFETELKQIDKTVAEGLISISDGSEMQLYMGNGNYSDELILIKIGRAHV